MTSCSSTSGSGGNGKQNGGGGFGGPRAHARGLSRAKVKTVKLTLTVIICYLLCWGPFFVAQMWAAWDVNAPFEGEEMGNVGKGVAMEGDRVYLSVFLISRPLYLYLSLFFPVSVYLS